MTAVADLQETLLPLTQVIWVDQAIHNAAVRRAATANRRQLSLVDCTSFELCRGTECSFASSRLTSISRSKAFSCSRRKSSVPARAQWTTSPARTSALESAIAMSSFESRSVTTDPVTLLFCISLNYHGLPETSSGDSADGPRRRGRWSHPGSRRSNSPMSWVIHLRPNGPNAGE